MEEPILNGLDAALHELGMLSSVTESRCEYLREQNRKSQSNSVDCVDPIDHETLGILHFVKPRFVKMIQTDGKTELKQFCDSSLSLRKQQYQSYTTHTYTSKEQSKREPHRFKPYALLSAREERIRTKSENSDVDIDWLSGVIPPVISAPDCCGLYKSRSLEDVKVTVSDEIDEDAAAPEVESVSDQIQQLQVSE